MKLPDNLKFSSKHVQVDKSYARIVLVISLASAIAIFSLVAAGTFIKKIQYQNSVISLRGKAIDQLEANAKAVDTLVASYEAFDSPAESAMGTPEKNSKIVLDALPSKYDFPALTTSLYYLIQSSGNSVKSISGIDEELSAEQSSANPTPKEMLFNVSASGSYDTTKTLLTNFERSIRPFKIQKLEIVGSDGGVTLNIDGLTYYQPQKALEITESVVPQGGTLKVTTTQATTNTSTEATQ